MSDEINARECREIDKCDIALWCWIPREWGRGVRLGESCCKHVLKQECHQGWKEFNLLPSKTLILPHWRAATTAGADLSPSHPLDRLLSPNRVKLSAMKEKRKNIEKIRSIDLPPESKTT